MNYTMITNHAQTCTSPPRGTRIRKIGFVAPILKFPSAKIAVRDKENRFFYLNFVCELYNDNKQCPRMDEPPLPPRGTKIHKHVM